MHLSLVDVLRCPNAHAPSSLIATIDHIAGGAIESGSLGCPVCNARFAIEQGGVTFSRARRERLRAQPLAPHATPDHVLRAAALLALVDPGGLILLGGAEASSAESLRERADLSVVLYNPAGPLSGWNGVTPIYADGVPLAPGVVRGAILDVDTGSAANAVATALRAGGRLVAPPTIAVPRHVRELARDGESWVAERVPDIEMAPVSLRRATT